MKLVKEHINFQRGIDPKDAMGTGDIAYREREKIKKEIQRAIRILVYDLKAKKTSVVENDGNGFDIQFNGKFDTLSKKRDCVYFIGYNFKGESPNKFYAGVEIYNKLQETEDSAIKYYDNVAECMHRIRIWADPTPKVADTLEESYNFERGIDPKEAMGTGDKKFRVLQQIHNYLDSLNYPEIELKPLKSSQFNFYFKHQSMDDLKLVAECSVGYLGWNDAKTHEEFYFIRTYRKINKKDLLDKDLIDILKGNDGQRYVSYFTNFDEFQGLISRTLGISNISNKESYDS